VKIYLYLPEKILTFVIPQKVSGSFSFDENPEEESKLINIEARNSVWYLYSTGDVQIVSKEEVSSLPLTPNQYYMLQKNNIKYLIYVSATFDTSLLSFSYKKDSSLIIGNASSCNVSFPSQFVNGVAAKLYFQDGRILLDTFETAVYVDNSSVSPNSKGYSLACGSQINIYGFKIFIYNGFLLLNNPMNCVRVNFESAKLSLLQFPHGEQPRNVEIKDIDLYDKNDYFSKSPRVRRLINTKEVNLTPPPNVESAQEMPLLLTIGPMLTMAAASAFTLYNVVNKIMLGEATLASSMTSLVSSGAMLISMLLWPSLTKLFNKYIRAKKNKDLRVKYSAYLIRKKAELQEEAENQRKILNENLITVEECLNLISSAKINFWDKRIDQNDFLEVRIGQGIRPLDIHVNFPEEGFTIEENKLRKSAQNLVDEFKDLRNVPISYSFYENRITAFMGLKEKCYGLIHNIILQLITFYSYEDIKLVVFTNKENEDKWKYIKYLNHCLSNDKSVRFFSSNVETAKNLADYLNLELQMRSAAMENGPKLVKPYYIIITDDYSQIKRHYFMKNLTETDMNLGFSLIILENQMSRLPSKCNNFINLGKPASGILTNAFESHDQIQFIDEINYSIDMMSVAKRLSNIPIEFEEGGKQLPESITFLEMEKVGKVEQLNIMNRWDLNDSTTSLKAEVGVDDEGNLMYLDLHEKFHGPHGLIAGMTGSGKSEFIITYILSMAINYSPDDVAFILIDYKGGGLAFAFENKKTGICLPHLAGTITNLDKAEIDRTLVSIDSEIKRRQQIFNDARDILGESTLDIYKYQRYFKEGKLKEPVPHLFIICDEFAELKVQQPDFMDNLISVARIGRSLGVHLILATQKPSGVVNDQIWSNTKFRVCLKVQDASDSKEMLKRPDAASLKQTGRFYLQVGYDEYFALGQSAWCGAKYFPSEKIIKQLDRSVNFIDDMGNVVKSIQAGTNTRLEAKGEQLNAILKNIIEVATISQKRAKRLWLNDIDPIILVDALEVKYGFKSIPYQIEAVIGEYDAPERQEQGLLTYSLNRDGNTIIYGNDEIEKEMMLNTIIYSICKNHTAQEVNIYAVDYGSEQLRMFHEFPQVGGITYVGDDEEFKNLLKLINDEIKNRKKILASYGGSMESYNNKVEEKLPTILFILNNYEGLLETYSSIYEELSPIARECERYGIVMLITCNAPSSIGRRVSQNFNNKYALHFNDSSDYYGVFNMKSKVKPRDVLGRGLVENDGIHEFQTASIVDEEHSVVDYMNQFAIRLKQMNRSVATSIPTLPDKVTFDIIEKDITTLAKVPIGISKDTLKVVKYDFTAFAANPVLANKLVYLNSFTDSLLDVLVRIPDVTVFFIDAMQALPSASNKVYNGRRINYYNSNFDTLLDKFTEIEKNPENAKYRILYIIYGMERLKTKSTVSKLEAFFNEVKVNENSTMILCDSAKSLKSLDFDTWYTKVKNNTDGIWIGNGFGEQQNLRISKISKEMMQTIAKNYGYAVNESSAELMKVLEFNDMLEQGDDEDEE
jgi:S-DNA-T family DNA segregation ATPase FtsK/SpoIIIE